LPPRSFQTKVLGFFIAGVFEKMACPRKRQTVLMSLLRLYKIAFLKNLTFCIY